MTPEQTGMVLAAIAARDSRTVGRADVMAWHEDIGDLDYADALTAVSGHFRESTDRIMPAHIRRIAVAARRERAERQRTADHLALSAGRPAEGSPEAAAVLGRLGDAVRRDAAARRVILARPESRPCRYSHGPGTTKCAGTVTFEAEAMAGTCDVCGMGEGRFDSGYGLRDRQARDTGGASGGPVSPHGDETGPGVGPDGVGNSEAAKSRTGGRVPRYCPACGEPGPGFVNGKSFCNRCDWTGGSDA